MANIKKVIIHCTDSEDSLDFGFRDIDEWHRQNGWLSDSGISCGYHWIVRRNGAIEAGRPETERGAHVKGHNTGSLGIVWVGKKVPGPKQYNELLKKIREIIDRYGLEVTDVYGHKEFDNKKTCPNLNMHQLRAELLFTRGEDK
mgnify:CR=1 FL=1